MVFTLKKLQFPRTRAALDSVAPRQESRSASRQPQENGRLALEGPFAHKGGIAWQANCTLPNGDDNADPVGSSFCLYEDDRRLTAGHTPHSIIENTRGCYSHWGDSVIFSTVDGSDPNTNGKVYSFDFSLAPTSWKNVLRDHAVDRWNLHPRGDYFRARGGDHIAPPIRCNIGLTNKCNLRCEICGSQKFLDASGVLRRHMDLNVFESVAETIFPLMYIVELNSQGDPLLYPHIETVLKRIAAHGCDIQVQHNGTLLTDRVIDLLLHQHGGVQLSLDAVGSKFDEVRRGGNWAKALPGLERFLRERDPARMTVGAYPTLTSRTINEAVNVVEWCAEHGMDEVAFHRFWPLAASWEKAPSDEEYEALKGRLRQWCADRKDPLTVLFESESMNTKELQPRRTGHAYTTTKPPALEAKQCVFPVENGSSRADPSYLCTAARDYVEIGLDGQISACCRAQDVALGYVTSVESFADAWLGQNYERLRRSLERGADGPYPLPNCEGCVKFFAPKAAGERRAVDYARPRSEWHEHGLDLTPKEGLRFERLQKEKGRCYIAMLPPGVGGSNLELWEDDHPLGPAGCLHDEIRELGQGRYDIGQSNVYFSTSDDSDARRNKRSYFLKPSPPLVALDGIIALRRNWVRGEQGHCHIVVLPAEIRAAGMDLWEDDRPLGPGECSHDEIRALGQGRYHIGNSRVYFSACDNSDPRRNDRNYFLKPAPPLVAVDGTIALRRDWVRSEQGYCHVAILPAEIDVAGMELCEDDRQLGPCNSLHDEIRTLGEGRYHIGANSIYFSAADNTDPRTNGRTYFLKSRAQRRVVDIAVG